MGTPWACQTCNVNDVCNVFFTQFSVVRIRAVPGSSFDHLQCAKSIPSFLHTTSDQILQSEKAGQGVVIPIGAVVTAATGVKKRSRGQGLFLVSVKRSRTIFKLGNSSQDINVLRVRIAHSVVKCVWSNGQGPICSAVKRSSNKNDGQNFLTTAPIRVTTPCWATRLQLSSLTAVRGRELMACRYSIRPGKIDLDQCLFNLCAGGLFLDQITGYCQIIDR